MLRLPDPEVPGPESAPGAPAESLPAPEPDRPARRQALRRSSSRTGAQRSARSAAPLTAVPQPLVGDPDPPVTGVEPSGSRSAAVSNPLFKAIDGGRVDTEEVRGARRRPVASGDGTRSGAPRRRASRVRATFEGEDATRTRPECYACPVGLAFGTVRGASPETMDHLVAASRELVAAVRTVMESLESNLERRGRSGAVQHIGLD